MKDRNMIIIKKGKCLFTSILLSFLSCGLSVLDKANDDLGEINAQPSSVAVSAVSSDKGVSAVAAGTGASLQSSLDVVEGESSPISDTKVDTGGVNLTSGSGIPGGTLEGGAVEFETHSYGEVTSGDNFNGKSQTVIEDFLKRGSSDLVDAVEYSSGGVSGTYGGGATVIEEEEDTIPRVATFSSAGEDDESLEEEDERRENRKYNAGLKEAKRDVFNALTLIKAIAKDSKLFDYYATAMNSSRHLGNPNYRENAREKYNEFSKEKLEENLYELLNWIKEGEIALKSADVYSNEIRAKNKLGEVREDLEKFIAEVKNKSSTSDAYKEVSSNRHKLSKMEDSLKTVKRSLYNKDNISN
ncbi:hypothetical protein DB313_05000 (plasmid) [Borrelia turcica IST7]|uniref:Fibronectin-binding protein n=1 Tax=Borrelia turcica IST7 TaxID=1104446 RepID=A0A386PPW3_9SPIR|nr:hypothetical protein [Borrelia turcica]AYE36857.1 hypothetical protein DB313_05000 [Borrelia turcica IST7]